MAATNRPQQITCESLRKSESDFDELGDVSVVQINETLYVSIAAEARTFLDIQKGDEVAAHVNTDNGLIVFDTEK